MTFVKEDALLPEGFRDLLPPDAGREAAVVEGLMGSFARHGYDRVKPPLMEFETSLLTGAGAAMSAHIFRLMDPVSQRMMGLRADMTPQVARIAAARLAGVARPLRLSYAGQVLRVRGTALQPGRQLGQVGAELIGAEGPAADAEAIVVAAEGLAAVGIGAITVDLNIATLVPGVAASLGLAADKAAALTLALDRRDAGECRRLLGRDVALIDRLLAVSGEAGTALKALAAIDLPADAAASREELVAVVDAVRRAAPELTLTVDPLEHRGFEYHTGVGFSLFAPSARGELGRGGRYLSAAGDPSTGFSLYLDAVLQALPAAARMRRIYLPAGSDRARGAALRADGWITIAGLAPSRDNAAEAKRLGCDHWLDGDRPLPV
ncbi:MAG: ATP phosphoribosyltransferase regulatory subunit [Dongiaceae bacterium]